MNNQVFREAISGQPYAEGMRLSRQQNIDRNQIVADIIRETSYYVGGVRWIRRELSTGCVNHCLSPEGWEQLERDFPYDEN